MYGISRIDNDSSRSHSWRVSLKRRNKKIVKNFADKKHGGIEESLNSAKAYRDNIIRENPAISRKEFCRKLRQHNTSGIPGVYRYAKRYTLKNGVEKAHWYWEAQWPGEKPGSFEKQTFSILQYGEDKARELAIDARRKGVSRLKGVFWASERPQYA
nr:AP2 domain-containing protein [Spongiibacter thalassae]